MAEPIPADNCPWHSTEHGWMVLGLPVTWWGAFCEQRQRLPARWQTTPCETAEVDPTDFEVECYVHLIEHEQARVAVAELQLLTECVDILAPFPVQAVEAAATGHTLIGWCPGLSWHWPDEDVPRDMARKFASR